MKGASVNIEKATIDDAQEILSLQKLAFQSEAKIHGDFQIPPLTETLDEWKETFKTHAVFKATVDGKIIGSVRVLAKEGTCYVGRLIVHPDFQNRGVGTKLLMEIERTFSSCGRFELFTGSKSVRNIHLYEKLGYTPFKTQTIKDDHKLVFLEKTK